MSNKKPQLTPESDITKMCVEIKLFVNGRELGTLDMYKPSVSQIYKQELVWYRSGIIAPWNISCTIIADVKADPLEKGYENEIPQ